MQFLDADLIWWADVEGCLRFIWFQNIESILDITEFW